MTAVMVGNFEAGSNEWQQARHLRLGGSEIAAVLGLSLFESRFSLWLRKQGMGSPVVQNDEMTVGKYVEDGIAHWWADKHPQLEVRTTGTWIHSDRPWQLASPDRLIFRDGVLAAILECKYSPYGEGWGVEGTDEIPDPYLCQTRWYSDVFGGLPVEVAGLIGSRFAAYRVEQDPADIALMLEAGRAFLDSIEAGNRPDIDDHAETYRIIRELHPDIEPGADHQLTDDQAVEYLDSKIALTAADKRHTKARSTVLDAMGSANYATWQGVRIARRQSSNGNTPHLASTRKDPRETPARTTRGAA